MENLIKQISMRIFQVEEENKAESSRVVRGRKISSRRTRSFKGDSQKGQNRSRRQHSDETSRDNEKTDGDEEFRTAIAAAAFAINSIENKEQEIKHYPNSHSRRSVSEIIEVPSRPKTNEDLPSEANQPKPTTVNSKIDEKVSGKTIGSTPSVEKTPHCFANKPSDEKTNQEEPESQLGESDIWEKTQMEKIKARFMRVKAKIFEWENKKKSKAKKKLTRKEGKLEEKRARALQDFKEKMEKIEKISRGARYRNEENRKREENRVKQKANTIRSTGKIQKQMCLCC